MTITTTTSTTTLGGNGITTVFSFPFIAGTASNIIVTYTDSGGNQTVLTPSLYTLFITPASPGQLWGVGGNVTYPLSGSPIASGTTLTIQRLVPITQTTTISNQGDFNPIVIEQALDTLCMEIQQVSAAQPRAIQFPPVDVNPNGILPAAAARAGLLLGFDGGGNVLLYSPNTPVVPPTTPYIVANIAALRALSGSSTISTVLVRGYYTSGDGGGGMFVWQAGSVLADNYGTIIAASGGVWQRTGDPADVDFRWFGCKVDGATDDRAAAQRALDWLNTLGGGRAYLTAGTMNISAGLTWYSFVEIYGDGPSSQIRVTAADGVLKFVGIQEPILRNLTLAATVDGATGILCTNPTAGSITGLVADAVWFDLSLRDGIVTPMIVSQILRCYFGASGSPRAIFRAMQITLNTATTDSNLNTVRDCRFFNGTGAAYMISIVSNAAAENWSFVHCDFEGCASSAAVVGIADAFVASFDNCRFERNTGAYCVQLYNSRGTARLLAVKSCDFYSFAGTQIFNLGASVGFQVENCGFPGCSSALSNRIPQFAVNNYALGSLTDTWLTYGPSDVSVTGTVSPIVNAQGDPGAVTASSDTAQTIKSNNSVALSFLVPANKEGRIWLGDPATSNNRQGIRLLGSAAGDGLTFTIAGAASVNMIATGILPNTTNAIDLGSASKDWRNIYTQNAVTVVSDERLKTVAQQNVPGLDFVLDLAPMLFTWKADNTVIDLVQTGTEAVTVVDAATGKETTVQEPHFEPQGVSTPGTILHAGFAAQAVNAAMDKHGVHWAAYKYDQSSDRHMTSPSELVPILVQALKDVAGRLSALEAKVK